MTKRVSVLVDNKPIRDRNKYLEEHREEQKQATLDFIHDNQTFDGLAKGGKMITKSLNGTGYFSQDNVKKFQYAMLTHLFSKDAPRRLGRGSFFETVDEFKQWAFEFFQLCYETDTIPTISGLATYLKISKDNLYIHANNPNSPFSEACQQAIEYCHVALENGASENKLNSVAYIFQAKNYFGMKDTQDVQVSAVQHAGEINSADTLDALREQKQQELLSIDAPTAKYVEKADVIQESE